MEKNKRITRNRKNCFKLFFTDQYNQDGYEGDGRHHNESDVITLSIQLDPNDYHGRSYAVYRGPNTAKAYLQDIQNQNEYLRLNNNIPIYPIDNFDECSGDLRLEGDLFKVQVINDNDPDSHLYN